MIRWQGEYFSKIVRFDGRVISLEREGSGGYFTALPISPAEYRQLHPTKARVNIKVRKKLTYFYITDDWGTEYVLRIANSMKNEIAAATKEIRIHGLLVEE